MRNATTVTSLPVDYSRGVSPKRKIRFSLDVRSEFGSNLEIVVKSGQRFDEKVGPFVAELVAAGDEEVQRLIKVKIVVSIEVAPDKLVDLLLGQRVQVLELVQSGELLHIQSIWCHNTGLPLQQEFRLQCRYVRNCGKNVRRVNGRPLHAVPVVYLPVPGLLIQVKLLKVIKRSDLPNLITGQSPPKHKPYLNYYRSRRHRRTGTDPIVSREL